LRKWQYGVTDCGTISGSGSRISFRPGLVGRPARDDRLFVGAVLYRYRAEIPWRDLPERFGDFRVVHTRFSRWAMGGVWQKLFEPLADEADNKYAMIDPTIVRAHQHSAGAHQKGARAFLSEV
jgi:transposase